MPVYSVKGGHAVKKVTVRMIGAAVGVSHSTVSRVLNNDPRVHPETRDLVLKTMRQMGYRIETGNGRRTVALILGNNRMTGYVSSVLEKLLFALRRRGILIRSCANYRGLDSSYYRVCVKRREENEEFLRVLSHYRG